MLARTESTRHELVVLSRVSPFPFSCSGRLEQYGPCCHSTAEVEGNHSPPIPPMLAHVFSPVGIGTPLHDSEALPACSALPSSRDSDVEPRRPRRWQRGKRRRRAWRTGWFGSCCHGRRRVVCCLRRGPGSARRCQPAGHLRPPCLSTSRSFVLTRRSLLGLSLHQTGVREPNIGTDDRLVYRPRCSPRTLMRGCRRAKGRQRRAMNTVGCEGRKM